MEIPNTRAIVSKMVLETHMVNESLVSGTKGTHNSQH